MKVEKAITIKKATEMMGVSRQTIYNWMNKGVLAYTRIGSTRVFRREDLKSAGKIMAERKFNGERRRGQRSQPS